MTKKSAWTDTILYSRPEEKEIHVKRELVPGAVCPNCDSHDVRRYPIANWMGPRMVTKCQDCFHVLDICYPTREDQWPPYQPITQDWPAALAERASVECMLNRSKEKKS